MGKYAVLLDGGFVTKALRPRLGRFPVGAEIVQECERVAAHHALRGHRCLRSYWYDAAPATGTITNPLDQRRTDLGTTPQHKRFQALHDQLELTPGFALRMGALDVRGWRLTPGAIDQIVSRTGQGVRGDDIQPDISQKGVDLRIGLDIARLSLRRLVDVLVVATGDSDLIPAFKFARREGLEVYLDLLGSRSVKRSLKVHADLVL